MGTAGVRKSHCLARIFKGRRSAPDTAEARALREQRPYLRPSRFQGVRPLQRKENSSRGYRRRLLVRLRTEPDPTGPLKAPERPISSPGSGIINPDFPFRPAQRGTRRSPATKNQTKGTEPEPEPNRRTTPVSFLGNGEASSQLGLRDRNWNPQLVPKLAWFPLWGNPFLPNFKVLPKGFSRLELFW